MSRFFAGACRGLPVAQPTLSVRWTEVAAVTPVIEFARPLHSCSIHQLPLEAMDMAPLQCTLGVRQNTHSVRQPIAYYLSLAIMKDL